MLHSMVQYFKEYDLMFFFLLGVLQWWWLFYLQTEINEKELRREINITIRNINGVR